MLDFDPDYDVGKQPVTAGTEGCVALWVEAARLYAGDALAVAIGRTRWRDGGQALRDLRGSRRILKRLCEPLDADAEAVARAIEQAIARGHGAGLHPPKPKKKPRPEAA